MAVINFRGRSFHRSRGCEGTGPDNWDKCCAYCDWGAFICADCGAAEGEVPTDCPRREMTEAECDQVMAGKLDYIVAEGGWVGYDAVVAARPRVVPVCTAVDETVVSRIRAYQEGGD